MVERTKLVNWLRWHLHVDPALTIPSRGLRRYCVIDDLAARLEDFEGMVARIARELVTGCGVLSAATILGQTDGASRFRSKDAFARFTGTPHPGLVSQHRPGPAQPRR